MPNVSVIMPIYNVEKYLPKCLDSVVNQTLQDIEIICVDDGSPDNCAAIVSEYCGRYSNITLIRQENGGLSSARNAGLDIATGEYIYFMDSDDLLDTRALELLYRTAAAERLDVLYFNCSVLFEDERILKIADERNYFHRPADYSGVCSGQTMFARMVKDGKFLSSVCIQLYRRAFLEAHQFRFYNGILHEDNLFTFQCAMTAQRVDYIPDILFFRQLRENSIMTSPKTIRHLEGYAVGYAQILNFVERHPLQENTAVLIDDYLYHDFWLNLVRLWNRMPEEERNKKLRHGGIVAAHLVALLKHDQQLAKEAAARADRLQQRVEVLTQQHDRLQQRVEVLTRQRDRLKATNEDLQRQLKRSPVARLKKLLRAVLQKIKKPR